MMCSNLKAIERDIFESGVNILYEIINNEGLKIRGVETRSGKKYVFYYKRNENNFYIVTDIKEMKKWI